MNKLATIIILLISLNAGSQKIIYVNDNVELITKKEYDSKLNDVDYHLSFDLDTLMLNVRVRRITTGKLSIEQQSEIRNSLTSVSRIPISREDRIVINFYPGIDECNSSGSLPKELIARYYKYSTDVAKIINTKQFFVYKSEEGSQSYGPKLNWFADKDRYIELLFFKLPFPCGSYVIIDPEGNYYCYKGEYNIDDIIPKLKSRKFMK